MFAWVAFFFLGKQALDTVREIKLRQLENDQYKGAWEYMYERENKQGKKKMQDGWQKSWQATIVAYGNYLKDLLF